MSIAYEINRLKLNKQQVKEQVNVDKDIINEGREFIRGETVRHYPSGIKSMEMSYKDFIPVHTSTESLIETERGGTIISKTLKGNTSQNGTPTPDAPVNIDVVTGENTINIVGRNVLKINDATNIGSYLNYNIQDGVIRITGTANNTYSTCTLTNLINIAELNKIPNGTKLTFSVLDIEGLSASQIFIGKAGNNYWMQPNATTKKVTATKNADITSMSIWFSTTQGQVYDITIKPMLVIGEIAYDYEPYQGKDYEINLGKNLLDENTLRQGSGYDSTITNRVFFPSNHYLEPDTYTLYTNLDTTNYKYAIGIGTKAYPNPVSYVYDSGWQTLDHVTFTLSKGGYLGVGVAKSDGTSSITPSDISNYHFMLCKGSYDSITSYSPYFEPIELNKIGDYQDFIRKGTGKNLLNTNKMLYGTISQTDGITISDNSSVLYSPQYIEVKPNTKYTLSCKVSNITIRLFNYENDNTYINTSIASTSNMTTSFTTSSNTYFIRLQYNQSFNVDMQLEEGSFTYYEPYNYGDKWYIEKNIEKVVLNGSENGWSYPSANRFNLDDYVNDYLKKNNDVTYVCDSYIGYGQKTANSDFNTLVANVNYGFDFGSGSAFNIRIKDIRYTSIADFKTWLQTHNIIVYYVLSSPTFETISDSTLISQLNENIYLLEGQNNISVSGNLPAGIDVDYIERVNKHLIGNTNESAE